jgi:signal transduction histidine kinase
LSLDLGLRYLTWATYVGVFLLTLRRVLRTPTPAHRDIALFFGATIVLIVLVTLQALEGTALPHWLSVGTGVVAMALPYLLLRLVGGFARTPAWVQRAAEAGLAVSSMLLVVAPDPAPGAVSLLLVAYFVVIAAYDTACFVREASRTVGVTRRRMQAAACASFALAGAVVFSGISALDPNPAHAELWTLPSRLLALTSGAAYYVAFAPPGWLRRTWQTPALQALLAEITRLPYLEDVRAVLAELEAHATAVIGAPLAAIGLWQEPEGVLRFWRGLGQRATPAAYPADLASRGFTPHDEVIDVQPERLFSGRAFLEQRAVFSADVRRDDPTNASLYSAWDVRAVLAAPISAGGRRLGLLTVWAPRAPVFAESDLELVQLLARQAAAVLHSRVLLHEVAEARARAEAERLKDSFLASISHDLRNPLTAVGATAQLLRRRLDRTGAVDPDRLRASIASIETSATQMARLVDQLLDYARLQLDRPLDLNRQPTDLVELTRRVVASHETSVERHQVRLETAELSLVGLWDQDRLERVLHNLLSNSIKYSPAGGEVRVGIRRELSPGGNWAVVSVEDEGLGIPAEEVPRIFDGFHRASNVSGRIAGTGIGLATARQVVEGHGGSIAVDSQEGHGSTFTVRLPLGPGPDDPSPPDIGMPGPGNEPVTPEPEPRPMPGLAWEGGLP